jgi:hypothetical protein
MTIQQKGTPGSAIAMVDGKLSLASPAMPCFVYQCSLELIVGLASPNSFELIGIRPEHIPALWNERISADDRTRLLARFNQLGWTDVASEIHRIIDDRGMPIWVTHSFQKVQVGRNIEVHGCMIPLPADFRAKAIESSIIGQFVHKIGNHFQLMNLLIGSLKRTGTNLDEIESLQQTIDKAVDFTRSFSYFSQSTTIPSPIDVAELLRSVVKSTASLSFEKDVALDLMLDSSIQGATVIGDAFLLEFAFAAVLQNALEAIQKGDQIVIRVRRESPVVGKGALVQVAIIDTGYGIERDLLAKVTDPFFTSKRDRDGLGLSTAVRIFETHGGAVNVSSPPSRGTEVQILLPIDDSEPISVNHVQRSHC